MPREENVEPGTKRGDDGLGGIGLGAVNVSGSSMATAVGRRRSGTACRDSGSLRHLRGRDGVAGKSGRMGRAKAALATRLPLAMKVMVVATIEGQ